MKPLEKRERPRSYIPVCGKRTHITWHDDEVVMYCIKDKGHRGPHSATMTWENDK